MKFTYHTKMHVGVVLTPSMQAALYDAALVGHGEIRPGDLPAPSIASFGAVSRRGLIDGLRLTKLGRSWIKAEVDAAHASAEGPR